MNKLLGTMARIYNRITKRFIDYLFLTAFALVLVYDYAFLTRFDREPFRIPYAIGAALAGIVLVLRFLNIKNENRGRLGFAIIILLIGGSYFIVRHSFYFLVLAMLIVGASQVEVKKIFAVYLIVATLFFTVMLTHFLLTTPEWNSGPQIHFGSINSTDCQGAILYITLAYLFYKGTHIRYTDLIVMGAIILWFWSHTQAEINMYCALAALVIAGFMKFGVSMELKVGLKPRRILGYVVSASFIVCAMVMIILAIRYDPDEAKWQELNLALHKRLECPHRMFALHPPSLWGSDFVQVGWGYSPGVNVWELYAQYGYTYIDSSYPHILINHGYLVFVFIVGVMTSVSCRFAKTGDFYKVLLLAVIACDCAAEGHLKEISCNVWLLLPLANCGNSAVELKNK